MRGITFTILAGCASLAVAGPGGQSDTNDYENYKVQKYIIWSWIALVGIVFIYRFSLAVSKKFRMVVTMGDIQNDGRQRYFSTPNNTYAFLKRHIILAPLFSKRHNREFKLSSAISVCTLPGRLHVLFLLALFASNAAYCAITIDWTNKSTFFSDGVHRTGVVLVTNIVALFLLAGRNNPLIYLLGISFDTYNLIHRWIGRLVVLETLAHAGFWVAGQVVKLGADGALDLMKTLIVTKPLFISGCIGTAAFVVLLLHSPGAIRHAFYETFLHIHILAAVVGTGAVWVHLNGLATQSVLLVAIIFWGLERLARFWWLMRRNIKGGLTKADFEVLPGEAIRVTMHVARPWNFQPGQHIYLTVPSIGLWTSHPFSVVWSQEQDGYSREKRLPTSRTDTLRKTKTSMSLIIRRRTGFTDSLFKKAEAGVGGRISRTAFLEGPYGSQSFRSYGTVMLFAAGVGVTHQVPHVRDLVQSFAEGTCATRKVTLVWVIQTPEHLEWIRPWMTQILGMDKRRDILKILLFVSRPRSTKEIHSPSSSVQMFPGKPDVAALVQKEQDHQIGAMAVSVCGTGGMADDVRKAVRDRQQRTEIDFYEEAFSW